jgi:hypothetical protein
MNAGFGYQSNYIKGKLCVCSKLLGILKGTLRWSSTGQMYNKINLIIFQQELYGKQEMDGSGKFANPSNAGYTSY